MHVPTCKQAVVVRHINMNQDARSAVLAKKGYLTYFATRRCRFGLCSETTKNNYYSEFPTPKNNDTKKFGFRNKGFYLSFDFLSNCDRKEWIPQSYQFSIQKWPGNVSFIYICTLILLIFCLHKRFILDNLLRGEA